MENLDRMKPKSSPMLSAAEAVIFAAILSLASGCASNTNKCLQKEGDNIEDKVEGLVDDCDSATDKYVSTTNADITRNPGVDSERFIDAVEACKLASKRAGGYHKDVVDEMELKSTKSKRRKKCVKAEKFLRKSNKSVWADAKRLRKRHF